MISSNLGGGPTPSGVDQQSSDFFYNLLYFSVPELCQKLFIILPPPPELFQALNIYKGSVTCFNTTPVCNVFKQGEARHMTQEFGSDTNMHEFRSINAQG